METKGNTKSVLSTELAAYLADSGTADNYAVALRPAITAYTTGLKITFQAANTNTGTATLAVNGLAAKTIKKSVSTNLAASDILANQIVTVTYDGTNFQMVTYGTQAVDLQPTDSVVIPNHCSLVVGDSYTIASGQTLTIGVGAVMVIL